jgi:hypothetical protein
MADQATGGGSSQQPSAATFSEAQLEQISEVAGRVANGQFNSRIKRLQEEMSANFSKVLEPISKQLSDLAATQQPPPGDGKGKGKGKDGDPAEGSPEFRGMQKQLADQKAAHDKLLSELAAEKAKAADASMRSALRDKLAAHGIEGVRAKHAIASLVDSEKRVRRDDDGQAVFIDTDGQPIDIDTGLKAWAKTEDAKIFLPPTGARGSGGGSGGPPPKQGNGAGEVTATDLGLAFVRDFGGIPIGSGGTNT